MKNFYRLIIFAAVISILTTIYQGGPHSPGNSFEITGSPPEQLTSPKKHEIEHTFSFFAAPPEKQASTEKNIHHREKSAPGAGSLSAEDSASSNNEAKSSKTQEQHKDSASTSTAHLTVEGILGSPNREQNFAILRNSHTDKTRLVTEGDTAWGFKLIKILKKSVRLEKRGQAVNVKLKYE